MIKRLVERTFPALLIMVVLVSVGIVSLFILLDGVIDLLGGEGKQKIVIFIDWAIFGIWRILWVLWGLVAVGWLLVALAERNNIKWVRVFLEDVESYGKEMMVIGRVALRVLVFLFLASIGMLGLVLLALLFAVLFNGYVEYWAGTILDKRDKSEIIKFIGWGIAGVLAIFGAIAVNRRANAQVENNKLVEKGHAQERFRSAVGHLGSEHESARIASFYELYHLARDNKDLQENILDILCAHLRQMTANEVYRKRERPTEDVQSLLDVLFQSKGRQERLIFAELKINLRGVFLVGANLQKAKLREVDLRETDLQRADLREANLQRADLQGADLRKVDLQEADLRKADLRWAKLEKVWLFGAKFQKADLQDADLYRAVLQLAKLCKAKLQSANLEKADLRGADLWRADLQDVIFYGADLRGADLRGVKNLETAKLRGAKVKDAKRPKGFEWPADADTTSD